MPTKVRKPGTGFLSRVSKPLASRAAALGLVAGLVTTQAGCLSKLILNGTISSTRKGSVALNTVPDFDIAQSAAFAGIAQLEGYRFLAPENENALFMLTRSWTSVAAGFIEDKMETVEDAEGSTSAEYDYQKRRAVSAYERAIWYGAQLLEASHEGLAEAIKGSDALRAYLKEFDDPEVDAESLFWLGYAYLGRAGAAGSGAPVAELWIGVAMLERSVELDETYGHALGHTALGAYHVRSGMAEPEEGKKHFDKAIAISEGKTLTPKVQYAIRYYCFMGDKENYEKLLNEVMEAGDGDPYQRLPNTLAKRKAKRWLDPKRERNCDWKPQGAAGG